MAISVRAAVWVRPGRGGGGGGGGRLVVVLK